MVYISSKNELKDFTIVEHDPDNPGMIRKQLRDLWNNNIRDLDDRVLGFVEPDGVNGTLTGNDNKDYMYKINIKDDWKRFTHFTI